MLARALLLGLLALASISSQAWATGPAYYPPGGSGSGVVANTCSAGDFFSAVDAGGNFTCSTPSGSGDVTAVGDCASGDCFSGSTGSTLTAAPAGHFVLKSSNSMYFDADIAAGSTGNAFVFRSNNTALTLARIVEDGYADLRSGLDLRLYDTDDSNYVEIAAPALGSNVSLTLPTSGGTIPSSATSPVTLSSAGVIALTQNAGTDVTADLEEETHASEHSLGGTDAVTVTNLASGCTDAQVLGGTAGGTGVECQSDADTNTNAATICAGTTTYLDGEGNCDDIAAVYAPIGASYVTSTAEAGLSGEQSIGALTTGILLNTVAATTGTLSAYAGTSCTNQFPRSLNASGVATCASVASADITDGTIAFADVNSTQTLAGNPANGASSVWFGTTGLIWEGATSNSNEGLLVAADVGGDRTWTLPDASGTIAVSASTPLTLNATTGNLTIADAAADSSTKGAVTFPSTHFTCTSGTCSLLASPTFGAASGTSYTWTWDLSSGTDPSLIFSTGAVALGSSTGLYGSTSSSGDLNLFSTTHATKGQINLDDQVDLWPSVADLTTGNNNTAVRFNSSTFDISGKAVFSLLSASSTTTMTGTLSGTLFPYYLGLDFSPTTTVTGDALSASYQYAVRMGGTSTATATTHLPNAGGFLHNRTYTTSQVNGWVLGNAYALDDQPIFTQTSASGTQQMSGHYSLYHHPSFNSNGSNPSGFTATNDFSILHGNVYTAAAGNTLTITARGGLKYDAYTTSGSGTVVVTDDTAVTCGALGVPGTQAACIKSAIQADAKRYFLKDTGGAQSSLAGKFTTYNNITTAGTGLPIITGESGVSATKTADFTALSYTPPATAGRYRVEQVITTTSGTNTGSFQCTVDYVDSQGTTHTADLMPMVNQTGLWATALPVVAGASKEWHCGPTYITINNSATAIVLKVDVTTGTVNYTVAASVEQLG